MNASRKRNKFAIIVGVAVLVIVLAGVALYLHTRTGQAYVALASATVSGETNSPMAPAATTTPVTAIPAKADLEDGYWIGQTFNNCAPSALSMDLSYYGIHVSQEQIADDLRPDHNTTGTDDDKSTSPEEVAAEAEKYGLTADYRANGNIQLLETFVANGIPVLVRTQFKTTEDVAHYRVIKGYDQATGEIIDEDGFQGPEVHYTYSDFMWLWNNFNDEYIVLVPPGKEALVNSILGANVDPAVAWQGAETTARAALAQDPSDWHAGFDLSVALYHLGDYQESVDEFQQVQPDLTEHVLWYQLEPIEAYLAIGDYSQVFTLSNAILNDNNPAYPELYVLMGQAYQKEGDLTDAKADYEKALFYNKNLVSAQQALAAL